MSHYYLWGFVHCLEDTKDLLVNSVTFTSIEWYKLQTLRSALFEYTKSDYEIVSLGSSVIEKSHQMEMIDKCIAKGEGPTRSLHFSMIERINAVEDMLFTVLKDMGEDYPFNIT